MRAWQLDDATASRLQFNESCPHPNPGPGEVLIRVHAAGVTPTELIWHPTTHTKAGAKRSRAIPGHEFSGTIAAFGPETSGGSIGQEVYGMSDWFADGATADYCITRPEWIAPKPARLTHTEAAVVPIGALTAVQGLFDHAKLVRGERVLIHGGSGAVGVFAVQLARRAGARVMTTASGRKADFLKHLGAERTIDYRTERFDTLLKDIDVVFDGVGGATLEKSWSVLSPNGRVVTIAASSEERTDERSKNAFFIVEPNRKQLVTISELLDRREIRVFVDTAVPFSRAADAYAGKIEQRLGRGKVVITVAE